MCRHIEQLWLQRFLSAKSCSCLVMSHDLVPEEDKPWTTVHRVQRGNDCEHARKQETLNMDVAAVNAAANLCGYRPSHQGRL